MKVKLMSGLSYRTHGHWFTRGDAVEVGDDLGEKLVKTGRFQAVADEVPEAPPEADLGPIGGGKEPPAQEPAKDADPEKKDGAVNV